MSVTIVLCLSLLMRQKRGRLRLLAEERRKEPLQIIEIGTRDTAITRQFLNALEDVSVAYTYADSSKYFLQEAEKELAGYERVEFEMLNLEEGMDKQQMSCIVMTL